MEYLRESTGKIRRFVREQPLAAQRIAILALALALIAVICIFSGSLANIHSEYAQARNELGISVYSYLNTMYGTYQSAGQPGADLQNSLLPSMRQSYGNAQTLDDAMTRCYGPAYQVLTATVRAAFNDAFSAYESAFRMGKSTSVADNSMEACMNSLESILLTRFDKNNAIIPRKN